jgi:hypothetical protein
MLKIQASFRLFIDCKTNSINRRFFLTFERKKLFSPINICDKVAVYWGVIYDIRVLGSNKKNKHKIQEKKIRLNDLRILTFSAWKR